MTDKEGHMTDLYIWKIERKGSVGYDQYRSAVVVAATETAARQIHPDGGKIGDESWPVHPKDLKVTRIGTAGAHAKAGSVIDSNFKAG